MTLVELCTSGLGPEGRANSWILVKFGCSRRRLIALRADQPDQRMLLRVGRNLEISRLSRPLKRASRTLSLEILPNSGKLSREQTVRLAPASRALLACLNRRRAYQPSPLQVDQILFLFLHPKLSFTYRSHL